MIVIGVILGILYIHMDKSFRVRSHSPLHTILRAHSQAALLHGRMAGRESAAV